MTSNKKIIGFIVILLGIFLRLSQYFANRSLWIDEAMLSLNIINKTIPELFQNLDYNQGAPIGFLLVEKSLTMFFGDSEFALRLFPLLCGIASLFFFFKLSNMLLSPVYSLCAVSLFAILNRLIYYSAEVKQYSSDVLIAILIFIVILQVDKMESFSRVRRFILFLLPPVLIWFSFPAIFVFFGALLSLTIITVLNANKKGLNTILIYWCLGALSSFLLYQIHLANLYSKDLVHFWHAYFIHFPLTLYKLNNSFSDFFLYLGILNTMTEVFFFVGVTSIFFLKKKELLVLASPVLVVLIVSNFNLYPIHERFLLFLVPAVIIFIVSGIHLLCEKLQMIYLLPVCIFLVLFQPLTGLWINLTSSTVKEEIKPAMSYVKRRIKKDDTLYVYYSTQYAYKYYAKKYGFNDSVILDKSQYELLPNISRKRTYEKPGFNTVVLGSRARNNPSHYIKDIDSLRRNKRVWFLFSHIYGNEAELCLNHLDEIGIELDRFLSDGAYVFLYDLSI